MTLCAPLHMTIQVESAPSRPGAHPSRSWHGVLDEAASPDEVVAVARDFIARLSPEEFSALPPDCRPRKLVDADDVVDYAVTLARESCAGESLADSLLHQIAAFFTHACARLSVLGSHAPAARQ